MRFHLFPVSNFSSKRPTIDHCFHVVFVSCSDLAVGIDQFSSMVIAERYKE
jgi:hypothetical protein